ncbi:hypothetical protein NECAME_16028 [Necator americanus]|uniref:Uncharacterized protein n=1 Tax=Necator americanus TaxID=51031 RepID=W2TZ62_NECAM|nr:hypothetical protein NECAME_16028 [Necator americanus]ETN86964.1 hypothetical protein NECAME_16028 [Necator americanus]
MSTSNNEERELEELLCGSRMVKQLCSFSLKRNNWLGIYSNKLIARIKAAINRVCQQSRKMRAVLCVLTFTALKVVLGQYDPYLPPDFPEIGGFTAPPPTSTVTTLANTTPAKTTYLFPTTAAGTTFSVPATSPPVPTSSAPPPAPSSSAPPPGPSSSAPPAPPGSSAPPADPESSAPPEPSSPPPAPESPAPSPAARKRWKKLDEQRCRLPGRSSSNAVQLNPSDLKQLELTRMKEQCTIHACMGK